MCLNDLIVRPQEKLFFNNLDEQLLNVTNVNYKKIVRSLYGPKGCKPQKSKKENYFVLKVTAGGLVRTSCPTLR